MGDGVVLPQAADVLAFWRSAGPDKWFKKDAAFDAEIARRFLPLWHAAAKNELFSWEGSPEGALALVTVLDQFPRNMFRGKPESYATDALAREVADRALLRGFDQRVGAREWRFFYLPFMHSEDSADQERCIAAALYYRDDDFRKHAEEHADIIRRFGRFPHRNPVLGRDTSPDEKVFLDGGGFAG
jgi:uncharacterized protein (DUF924 family)